MDAETFIRASLVLGFRYFRKIRSISHIRLTNSAINDFLRYRIHLIADFSSHSFERSTIQWDMLRAISNPLRDIAFLTEHRAVNMSGFRVLYVTMVWFCMSFKNSRGQVP